jgi:hypothetical protein
VSALKLPRKWATDTNFSSGTMSGTPTKVDPGAAGAAQGFVPGSPVSATAHNDVLSRVTEFMTQFGPGGLLALRECSGPSATNARMLTTYNLTSLTDNKAFVGAGDGIKFVGIPTQLLGGFGTLAAVTFKGVARNVLTGGRIAGVFNNANPLAHSDNNGSTWTTVAAANCFAGNTNAEDIGFGTIFGACVNGVTNAIFSSTNAATGTWTNRSLNGTAGDIPKRIVGSPTSGRAIVLGTNAAGTAPFMAESANGTAWSAASVPAAANAAGGDICYDPVRERFWWLAKTSTGFNLYYTSTTGAASWTLACSKTIGASVDSLAIDPAFGIIYISGAGGFLGVSLDDGATWFSQSCTINSVSCVPGCLLGLDTNGLKVYMGPGLFSHGIF